MRTTPPETNAIIRLLEEFEKQAKLPVKTDILKYWLAQKEKQRTLFDLAQVCFAAPSSQASVERAFSTLKFILNNLRYNLNDKTLQNILIIKLNYDLSDS